MVDQKSDPFSSSNPTQVKPVERRSLQARKARWTNTDSSLVAAIRAKNLVKVVPEKAVQFKVRAVVIVRNKHKEDLKESIVRQLDALTDKLGRNVVLELVSTEIDPSKPLFPSFLEPK